MSEPSASPTRPPSGLLNRTVGVLMLSNALGGIGVASGIAVGALLVQSFGGTALAGVGQALSVLGAGFSAVPLAGLARRRGRRTALTVGYLVACAGAVVVLLGATAGLFPAVLAGLVLFGVAQATNLQTRYAAADGASPGRRASTLSLVMWATTIGSVAGPNLSQPGANLARGLGIPPLSGPYLFSLAAFALALASLLLLPRTGAATAVPRERPAPVAARTALGWAMRHPTARYAVVLIATAHAVMVGLMAMTSVHLVGHRHGLEVVGVVVSLHILGMYALSPVFGALADRIGAMWLSLTGMLIFGLAFALSWLAGFRDDVPLTAAALVLLGLGWSAAMVSSSALFAGVDSGELRVPLQGATDAVMSYAGAAAAVLSAPMLAAVGYSGLSIGCALLLLPAAWFGWIAHRQG